MMMGGAGMVMAPSGGASTVGEWAPFNSFGPLFPAVSLMAPGATVKIHSSGIGGGTLQVTGTTSGSCSSEHHSRPQSYHIQITSKWRS